MFSMRYAFLFGLLLLELIGISLSQDVPPNLSKVVRNLSNRAVSTSSSKISSHTTTTSKRNSTSSSTKISSVTTSTISSLKSASSSKPSSRPTSLSIISSVKSSLSSLGSSAKSGSNSKSTTTNKSSLSSSRNTSISPSSVKRTSSSTKASSKPTFTVPTSSKSPGSSKSSSRPTSSTKTSPSNSKKPSSSTGSKRSAASSTSKLRSSTTKAVVHGAFPTGFFAPPVACPKTSAEKFNTLYTVPIPASVPWNATLSPFDLTDPTVNNISLIGDPTFTEPFQVVTNFADTGEDVLYSFSSFESDAMYGGVVGITATVANGSSLTIYSNGSFSFFTGGCRSMFSGSINVSSLGTPPSVKRDVVPRSNAHPVSVMLALHDSCGNHLLGLAPDLQCQIQIHPGLGFQDVPVPFLSSVKTNFVDNGDGTYTGICMTPDTESLAGKCVKAVDKMCTKAANWLTNSSAVCTEVGLVIGEAIGAGIGASVGWELGPGVVLSVEEGALLGGAAARFLCKKGFSWVINQGCKNWSTENATPFCQDISKDVVVGVQAVHLPGGATRSFSSIQPTQTAIVATKTLDNAVTGATCTRPGCDTADYSASPLLNHSPWPYASELWSDCNTCCVDWIIAEYGGACICCIMAIQYTWPDYNRCSNDITRKCCSIACPYGPRN